MEIVVNTSNTFQEILGYGGAFTDSAGINLNSLSEATRTQLLKAYFDANDGKKNFKKLYEKDGIY